MVKYSSRSKLGMFQEALTVAASVALSVALAFVPGFGLDKTSALGGALGASELPSVLWRVTREPD